MGNTLKSICIVGGGTAGWMAASLLSTVLQKSHIKITLVESLDIASVGVGESTVPSIMDFLHSCQIDPQAFVKATSASFKLGVRFDGWQDLAGQYFHPFGKVGEDINGFSFYQAWMKTCADGKATRLMDHAPAAMMAQQQRFILPPKQSNNWTLQSYSYALHLDAALAARYLRDLAQERGVKRVEATVNNVSVDDKQFIHSLELSDGTTLNSDFFIDCTGARAVLIEKALKVGYQDWTDYLPCNRAATVQTKSVDHPQPFTVASAQAAGWSWKIPLQHRTGNGYVFSSQHCTDDEAIKTLLGVVDGEPLSDPKIIPFATGKRHKIWHNNCLALGLSSGFLEPLESTAIHLVYKSLIHFIRHFPDRDFDLSNEREFNKKIDADYGESRDFVILHYCLSKRKDTPFWASRYNMPVPESLREKINVFCDRGYVEAIPGRLFSPDSWFSVFEGMQVRPKKYHPLMDTFDSQHLAGLLTRAAQRVQKTVAQMPSHGDYIKQHCAAQNESY